MSGMLYCIGHEGGGRLGEVYSAMQQRLAGAEQARSGDRRRQALEQLHTAGGGSPSAPQITYPCAA